MYIISKQKDYYDGVAGTTGIDKTIVYERQMTVIDGNDIPKIFRGGYRDPSPFYKLTNTHIKKELSMVYLHTEPFFIGFCGKLYIGWKLYSEGKVLPYGDKELITTITYDNENMKKLVEKRSFSGNFEDNLNSVLSYDPIEIFRSLNTPSFVYDADYDRKSWDRYWRNHPKFIINPLLKEYQFYKIFDTFTAFQEIQMFLGGVLGSGEKEIVEVADKYKIGQHGFDKWSFRREPEKKS